ncbi:MAG: TonB-dependent receptor [Lautropia sp.]|nr:TonB-dependent receptor [Lautropia sp.]
MNVLLLHPFRLPPFRRAGVLVALSTCLPAFYTPAAHTAQTAAELGRVVVTATREPQLLDQSAGDIVLIDRSMLVDGGIDSVEEALRRHAGVQLTRSGGPGQSAGYFVRGVGSSGTVVLLDGVRVGSASLGQFDLSSLAIGQIERIEVLRGPASGLYGADAVGGVINIITRRGEGAPRLTGNLMLGGYRSREGSIGISGASGAYDYALGVSHEKSRGVSAVRPSTENDDYNPDADGFKRTVGTARVGYTPMQGHRIGLVAMRSELDAQYDGAEYDAPDFTPDATPDFRNHLDTSLTALDYRGKLSQQWTTSLRFADSVDDSDTGGRTKSRYKTDREQWTWQNRVALSSNEQLMLAYERLTEEVSAENFVNVPERTNKALMAGYVGTLDQTTWEGSIRRDDNSAHGKKTTGSIGFNHVVSNTTRLRAVYGTTFRAPTFNDLYYPGYGVATLEPEKGRSIELGMNWQEGGDRIGITAFRNKVRDMIVYDSDSTGTICPVGYFGCAANTARAKLRGISLEAGSRQGVWQWGTTIDWLKAIDETTGERLARRARHQATLSIDYVADQWRAGVALTRVGSRPDNDRMLAAYNRIDLTGSWRVAPQWRIEAKLLNATDRDIEPIAGYRDLGRQAWVGVRIDTGGL